MPESPSELNAKDLKVLQRAYRRREQRVSYSNAWQKAHGLLRIGVRDGKYLHLTDEDYDKLHLSIKSLKGFDVQTDSLNKNRVGAAKLTANEKLAKHGPSHNYIQIACRSEVSVAGQSIEIPAYSQLRLRYQDLALAPQQSIVVVENLEAMNHWHHFVLPSSLHNAIAVYRGHDALARGVKSWLAELHANGQFIVYFPDYDLSGLGIALSETCNAILIPSDIEAALQIKADKPSAFAAQYADFSSLEARISAGWAQLLTTMKADASTITQEAMAAHKLPLMVLNR